MNHDYTLHLVEQGLIDQPLTALEQAAALDQFQAQMLASLADDEPTTRAASWTDGDNPEWKDGCSLVVARAAVVATCALIVVLRLLRTA